MFGKAFAVLRAFRPEAPELTISEVAAFAGLDRGTAFRLIHTLVDLGYLAGVPGTRRFWLTLKCLELGHVALAAGGLQARSRPVLQGFVPGIICTARQDLDLFIAAAVPPLLQAIRALGGAVRLSAAA